MWRGEQTKEEYSSSSWLLRRIRQCSGSLVLCLSENNRAMRRGVFLQVHCGHCPRMRCLICARPCCCACLWALDVCTAAWIIEASHAVRVQQALLALSLVRFPSVLFFLSPLLATFLKSLCLTFLSTEINSQSFTESVLKMLWHGRFSDILPDPNGLLPSVTCYLFFPRNAFVSKTCGLSCDFIQMAP